MKKRDKNKYKENKRLEIILVIYSLLYNKMENYKEQYKKKGDKELKLMVTYCLA